MQAGGRSLKAPLTPKLMHGKACTSSWMLQNLAAAVTCAVGCRPSHHDLIWSLNRCSFFISFFKSASNFSFWLLLSVSWTCRQRHQTPTARQGLLAVPALNSVARYASMVPQHYCWPDCLLTCCVMQPPPGYNPRHCRKLWGWVGICCSDIPFAISDQIRLYPPAPS